MKDKFDFICAVIIIGALAVMLTSAAMELLIAAVMPSSSSVSFPIKMFLVSMAVIGATSFAILAKTCVSRFLEKREDKK